MYVNIVCDVCTMDTETKKFRRLFLMIEISPLYTKKTSFVPYPENKALPNIEVITLYFAHCR
jgi:hypothetical protein